MGSERELLNISLIKTFHSFNFLNVQLYLYQNWESEDCLISSRIIWGTPTKLSESVSLLKYKEWHLFIFGYASASIVSFWNNFLDFWRLFDSLKVFFSNKSSHAILKNILMTIKKNKWIINHRIALNNHKKSLWDCFKITVIPKCCFIVIDIHSYSWKK